MPKVQVYKTRGNRRYILLVLLIFVCGVPFACCSLIGAAVNGLFGDAEILNQTYSEPKDGVEVAEVEIKLGVGKLELGALNDSNDLFDADITYVGGLDYNVSGRGDRNISLRQTQGDYDFLGLFSLFNINLNSTDDDDELLWDINLSPDVPLELDIEGGVGGFELDLSDLEITELKLETGVGDATVTLAEPEESYTVTINGGVGNTTIILLEGAAVRIEAETGVGDIDVSGDLERISDNNDENGPSDEGIWETDDFDEDDNHITIIIDGGVGDLTVR